MNNIEWIQKGNTGCTFATLFSKNPESIGWKFISFWDFKRPDLYKDAFILSIVFDKTFSKIDVERWALTKGFYLEIPDSKTRGLRYKCEQGEAWVQYFGPDSHVVTRRTPYPMLTYCQKTGASYYWKVGFKGVLHLAHAWREGISKRVADTLWNRAHKQTRKLIGHDLTIEEAAKTTFLK